MTVAREDGGSQAPITRFVVLMWTRPGVPGTLSTPRTEAQGWDDAEAAESSEDNATSGSNVRRAGMASLLARNGGIREGLTAPNAAAIRRGKDPQMRGASPSM